MHLLIHVHLPSKPVMVPLQRQSPESSAAQPASILGSIVHVIARTNPLTLELKDHASYHASHVARNLQSGLCADHIELV